MDTDEEPPSAWEIGGMDLGGVSGWINDGWEAVGRWVYRGYGWGVDYCNINDQGIWQGVESGHEDRLRGRAHVPQTHDTLNNEAERCAKQSIPQSRFLIASSPLVLPP